MAISRRARRTDLREGSLDVSNLFVNATTDTDGKIVLPNANAATWNVLDVPFSLVTIGGKSPLGTFPHQIQLQDENSNLFDIQKETNATNPANNSYLLKLFVNGIKVDANFNINQNILFFELNYEIESDDTITLWYVEL